MNAIEFDEQVTVLAKDQDEYNNLPVHFDPEDAAGTMTARFTFTPEERKAIADGADLWVSQLTFGKGFHPVQLGLDKPDHVTPPSPEFLEAIRKGQEAQRAAAEAQAAAEAARLKNKTPIRKLHAAMEDVTMEGEAKDA